MQVNMYGAAIAARKRLAEKTAQQGDQGDADEGNAAAQGDDQSLQNVDSVSKKAHIHISFRSVELSG